MRFGKWDRKPECDQFQHADNCYYARRMPSQHSHCKMTTKQAAMQGQQHGAGGVCNSPARTLMLKPAFALVSMNMTLKSRAFASPSSIDTCLRADDS